jgi:hypothetical protein
MVIGFDLRALLRKDTGYIQLAKFQFGFYTEKRLAAGN